MKLLKNPDRKVVGLLYNRIIISNLLNNFSGEKTPVIFERLDAKQQKLTIELFAAVIGASVKPYSKLLDSDFWAI